MNPKRPFFSTAFFSLLGRAGGLAIPFFIGLVYGANASTDAFFFAYSIIFYLIGIFSHLFEAALIPYLVEHRQKTGSISGPVNAVFWTTVPVMGILCGLFWLILEGIFGRTGPWDPEFARQVPHLFLELIPLLFLSTWISSAHGSLYLHKAFWLPAASPLFRSVVTVLFILTLKPVLGIRAVTAGLVLGEVLRGGVIFFRLSRLTSSSWKIEWGGQGPFVKKFFREGSFQLLALVAVNLVYLSDQWLAAWLGAGSLSLLNYADRLLQIPYLLFATSFLHIFLADWSDSYQRETASVFWPRVQRDLRTTFGVSLLLGAGLWFLRFPLMHTVYGRGDFTPEQLQNLSLLFGWLALGLIPGIIRLQYGRLLFVMRKSIFYCVQSWAELALNIVLNIIFMIRYGVVGIAMSTALVYSLNALWLHFYLKRASRTASRVG